MTFFRTYGNILLLNERRRLAKPVAKRERPNNWAFSFLGVIMIDFKTYEEQITILKGRNLIIENESAAIDFIAANNYYNVINAYKSVFIKTGVTPETFIDGTTFSDIISLYAFDKHIRLVFSEYLIEVERTFKSVIAYEFSKAHPCHDLDYTNINNFDITNEPIESSKLATGLYNRLQGERLSSNKMICHYIQHYAGRVPLWVFANVMSFGTVSKFFMCMKENDKRSVAKNLSTILHKNVQFNDINNSIKILVLLRNKAAHDQRIYDFSSERLVVSHNNVLMQAYHITKPKNDLFGAIGCMYDFMDQDLFEHFKNLIKDAVKKLYQAVNNTIAQKIVTATGIPKSFFKKQQ